jgi:hypothetical protein
MCGRPLVETRPAPPPAPSDPVRDSEPASPAPAYTGGIFNLGAPADKPSRSLDYLLEDDDEPKSNKGLIFLTLVALALVVGLGWLRWRNGGLPFLKSLTSTSQPKPAASPDSSAAQPAAPLPDQPTPAPAASSPSITPLPEPAQSQSAQANPPASAPATAPETSSASPAASSAPAGSSSDPNAAVPAAAPAAGHEAASEEKPDKSPQPATEAAAPPPAAHAKPKPVAKPAPKPAAKATDPVVIGERYLYGREGFPQNCERGLHYVKPAADQSNPKAMITMGALYATGHCLSRDLPTAYRFFALALRGDPENGPLRQNAEMVWKQMTAEERKQAIRMTQ